MTKARDYYDVMGLTKGASDKDIKMAYRRLARKYHPDINKEPDAEEKFKELGQAYEVLKDPKKRAEYDQFGQQEQFSGQEGNPFYSYTNQSARGSSPFDEDLLSSLFGFGRHKQAQMKGEDYNANITLSLDEAYKGTTRQVEIPYPHVNAQGEKVVNTETLQVKIPPGIVAGHKIRLLGKGGPSYNNGPNGNLYLTVHFHQHPYFDVKEKDIYLTLPITPWEAALGASVKVPTLGGRVDLKIPAGSQTGQQLRLKGRGLPGKVAGDQLVLLKVVVPLAKDEHAKKLYEQMQRDLQFNPREIWERS
ncbi:MAG: cytochrome C biogenesis protein [Legionellales bacterium RIFCSPHIGHO2_12_FULL_37_14]|nr:MAG: cytochrome C biogenesis protein [Legionellales bacterium RIFCSPHIGHO2_12_FULL_37_14]